MADLKGGTTIGGYLALHSGLAEAYLGGNLTVAGVVRNAAYNDVGEVFLADEHLEPGDVVMKNPDGPGYIKACGILTRLVVGVVSDTYGYKLGGEGIQEEKQAVIGIAGRVNVKVIGNIRPGDLLVATDIPGVASSCTKPLPGTIIGKALGHYDSLDVGRIPMLILNA